MISNILEVTTWTLLNSNKYQQVLGLGSHRSSRPCILRYGKMCLDNGIPDLDQEWVERQYRAMVNVLFTRRTT